MTQNGTSDLLLHLEFIVLVATSTFWRVSFLTTSITLQVLFPIILVAILTILLFFFFDLLRFLLLQTLFSLTLLFSTVGTTAIISVITILSC